MDRQRLALLSLPLSGNHLFVTLELTGEGEISRNICRDPAPPLPYTQSCLMIAAFVSTYPGQRPSWWVVGR